MVWLRSCQGFAALLFKCEVQLGVFMKCDQLFSRRLFFHTVGGKKSFFFTPVGLDIVYSKSGIRNNSCHIYIQMTFKRSYFVVWAPIPMQFHQVYSPQYGTLTANLFYAKMEICIATAVPYFASNYEGFNFSQRNKRGGVSCKALERKDSIVSH